MSAFLSACRREPTMYTPVWLMRQAGRYQAKYRDIRSKLSFIEMCKTPEISAEVTLLPVRQFGVDAAIQFADILLILEPLEIGFEFTEKQGPRILKPVRTAGEIDAIREPVDIRNAIGYLLESIRIVRAELSDRVPLIGFAGAPFTLASYLIEGGASQEYVNTKRLMFSDPTAWDVLMTKLTNAVVEYLNAQVDAGVQALQVFDSWVGCLSPADYRKYVRPHMNRLFRALNPSVPVIHFGTGNPALYPLMKQAGGDVIGIDWRADLELQWSALGEVAIMGNLDPSSLLAPIEEMKQRAKRVIDSAKSRPGHIFNLGHGVLPQTDESSVKLLVDFVHEYSSR
ncbi:MAG: uroporphyrinogen decarboxylase [Deltaproteobacteria bacterium]|nr:uroporphyrinogen decarboxylase [Deltaproteobacteria bacterium]